MATVAGNRLTFGLPVHVIGEGRSLQVSGEVAAVEAWWELYVKQYGAGYDPRIDSTVNDGQGNRRINVSRLSTCD